MTPTDFVPGAVGADVESRRLFYEDLEWMYQSIVSDSVEHCGFDRNGLAWPLFEQVLRNGLVAVEASRERSGLPNFIVVAHVRPEEAGDLCRVSFVGADQVPAIVGASLLVRVLAGLAGGAGPRWILAECRSSSQRCVQVLEAAGFVVRATFDAYYHDGDGRLLYQPKENW